MIDYDEVLEVLQRQLPGVSQVALAAAAAAIAKLPDEWEEVTAREQDLGYHYSARCFDICYLADQVDQGARFRLFRKRLSHS